MVFQINKMQSNKIAKITYFVTTIMVNWRKKFMTLISLFNSVTILIRCWQKQLNYGVEYTNMSCIG